VLREWDSPEGGGSGSESLTAQAASPKGRMNPFVAPAIAARHFALTTLLGAILAGCAPADEVSVPANSPPATAPVSPAATSPDAGALRPGIRFHPDTMTPGSPVGELVLDSVWRRDPPAGRDADTGFFTGMITVSGSTVPHPDADAAEISVCFRPDTSSASRMPRWAGDERHIWFCFDNSQEAARSLAGPGEQVEATVVISDYRIHYGASDEVNTARLVDVASR
jgi:hypothetical protein